MNPVALPSAIRQDVGEALIFEASPGAKAAVTTGLIGLFSLGLFAVAIGLVVENSGNWGKALASVGIGAALALWFVFEARGFLFCERYYQDRAERVRGGNVVKSVRFDDEGFKFSFRVRADGSDATLTLSAADGTRFTLIAGAGPGSSNENVEKLRDHLASVVASRITRTLSGGGQFDIDDSWSLSRGGAEIDGQLIPWSELRVAPDNRTGEAALLRGGAAVARRSMMDDNVLGVLEFLATTGGGDKQGTPTRHAA